MNRYIFLLCTVPALAESSTQGLIESLKTLPQIETQKIDQFLEKWGQESNRDPTPPFEIENLIEGKDCRGCGSKEGETEVPGVKPVGESQILIFATFAMSDQALQNYARDLEKVGGRLIVRGLVDDSFTATKKRLETLGVPIDIDPPLFELFGVEHVPTIIHAQHQKGEYRQENADRIAGQVTLDYAVEVFSQSGTLPLPSAWVQALQGG